MDELVGALIEMVGALLEAIADAVDWRPRRRKRR